MRRGTILGGTMKICVCPHKDCKPKVGTFCINFVALLSPPKYYLFSLCLLSSPVTIYPRNSVSIYTYMVHLHMKKEMMIAM